MREYPLNSVTHRTLDCFKRPATESLSTPGLAEAAQPDLYSLASFAISCTYQTAMCLPHQMLGLVPIGLCMLFLTTCLYDAFSTLKGNATDFTHLSLFKGLEEYYCICEKGCVKPFVAIQSCTKSDKGYG